MIDDEANHSFSAMLQGKALSLHILAINPENHSQFIVVRSSAYS